MPHHFFLTHSVPNTPQVKPTEDNCEAYFTQHVSNVTLCRCQIYSVAPFITFFSDLLKKCLHNSLFTHLCPQSCFEFGCSVNTVQCVVISIV
jgi:hypothetical protein